MKYLTFIRHSETYREGAPPAALMKAMETFVERSYKDGTLVETGGLLPSKDGVMEWVRRCPDPMPGEESEIEIRPLLEAEDFGTGLTPELRAQEERLRTEIDRQRKG